MEKANLGKRLVASLIDYAIVFVVGLLPFIGSMIGLIYILTRDAIVYEITKNEDFKNRSVGKQLMGLEVTPVSGEGHIDLLASIKRNSTLAIGALIGIILTPIMRGIAGTMTHSINTGIVPPHVAPYMGALAGVAFLATAIVGLIVAVISGIPVVIELLMVVFNKNGDRLGDKFAGTHVVEVSKE